MADRLEFYVRQTVTEKELNLAFGEMEAADRNLAADLGVFGVISGAEPTPHVPVADLTIDLTAPGRAYDRLGQRIFFGSGQRIDCSRDFQGIPTEVTTPTRERWLGIFVRFARRQTDPRIAGDSVQVFFRQDEACEFVVRQGAEGVAGGAAFVPLEDDELLVCDVRRVGGQTAILLGHIDTRRRQVFVFAHGDAVEIDPRLWKLLSPGRANVQATFDTLDAEIAGHVGGSTRRHNADHVDFAPQGFLEAKNVGAALRELVALLASVGGAGSSGGAPGAARIGVDGIPGAPYAVQPGNVRGHLAALLGVLNDHIGAAANAHAASAIAAQPFEFLQARTVQGQLRDLVAALKSTDGGLGGAQVGSDAIAGAPKELAAGTLHSQLGALLGHLNGLIIELSTPVGASRIGSTGFFVGGREVGAGTIRAQVEAVVHQLVAHTASGDHDGRYLSPTYTRGETFAPGEEKSFEPMAWPALYTFETGPVGINGQPGNPINLAGAALFGVQAQLWKSDAGYALRVKNATGAHAFITVRGYS